jgi:hypothetical protein
VHRCTDLRRPGMATHRLGPNQEGEQRCVLGNGNAMGANRSVMLVEIALTTLLAG